MHYIITKETNELWFVEANIRAGQTFIISNKGQSGQITCYTSNITHHDQTQDIENVGTITHGDSVTFTATSDATYFVGYANSATTIDILMKGTIVEDLTEDSSSVKRLDNAFIAAVPVELEIGTIVSGNPTASTKYARSVNYLKASKGDVLTFSPADFALSGIAVYLYTEEYVSNYETAISIGNVAIGSVAKYEFPKDTYFKVRIARSSTPDLSNNDVEVMEQCTVFNHCYGRSEFDLKGYSPSELPLDYTTIKSGMAGKVNFAIQTDTHMSSFFRYNGASKWNISDFDTFKRVLLSIGKLGFDAFANLGDIVAGYGFDPDYETRKSLDNIISDY